jgi:hypothetical protein
MNLRHDAVPGDTVLEDAAALGDATVVDDELFADELAGIVEFAAAFLASGQSQASDFAAFTCGIYSLDELRADLWNLGARIRGNA